MPLVVALSVPAGASDGAPVPTPCPGDCDELGEVTIDELLVAVDIALGAAELENCRAADANGDTQVSVTELVLAVANAFGGCAAPPTPTAPPGGTPSPTPAETPGHDACPLDFDDDLSAPGLPLCLFAGRWNEICGATDLEASFVGDGSRVIASVRTAPPVFFAAETVAADLARLRGWATDEELSDFQPLDGSVRLVSGGRTLLIGPAVPPFDIHGCPFELYAGEFSGRE